MFSNTTKAAIAGAIRRSIPRGIAWSVYGPNPVDGDFGTTTGEVLITALNIRFKRLSLINRPERFVNDNRAMYTVTALNFPWATKQQIKDPDQPSAGTFEVVDVVNPPDCGIPTASYATVVRL